MTKDGVKTAVGVALIAGQFSALLLIIVGYFGGGFKFSEMTTAIAITAPVFAAYTTVIVRSLLASSGQNALVGERDTVRPVFAVISLGLPIFFISFVLIVIAAWIWSKGFDSFEEFKVMLGLSEVIFGVYLGAIVKALYGE